MLHERLTRPTPLLDALQSPQDVAALSADELQSLADELRRTIVATVSRNGGHLAASLGVVELTLSLLCSFNPDRDRLIWDVGHQSYAYKLLTGRWKDFDTLRRHKGVNGFPSPQESPYDHFGVGHSSTSISAALGMATARDLAGEKHHVLAVIGDGSMTAGLAFEGLNQAGAAGKRLIVVLNDNAMSISKNVGALSFFLSRKLSEPWMRRTKRELEALLGSIPRIGQELASLARKSQHSLKGFFTPGMLFEAFRFNYIGPVDGHDVRAMNTAFAIARQVDKPVLVHALTVKGKGYPPAEANPVHFHGVGRFIPATGEAEPVSTPVRQASYSNVFGETLVELARQNPRIVAITAAMPEGTGLSAFRREFPERFVDVGICEQHAVTYAAGLAMQGFRPLVAIYSTFLQRAYDQIVHDVCLQNLPVLFCIDRAGLVGEDGATHQGLFDVAFLRHIPNMRLTAPGNATELRQAMIYALSQESPLAIRYPRGSDQGVDTDAAPFASLAPLPFARAKTLCSGDGRIALLALGNMCAPALEAASILRETQRISAEVCNALWVKPLPEDDILRLASECDVLLTLEEGVASGGFGSAVLELLARRMPERIPRMHILGLPDSFIEHGAVHLLRRQYGLDAKSIAQRALRLLPI